MKSQLVLAPLLWMTLASCEKAAPPPPPVSSPSEQPGLSLTSTPLELGGTVKARRFDLKGRSCTSIEAKLVHLSGGQCLTKTDYKFEKLPASLEGSLWFLAQDGEPFGKKGQTFYSLGQSLKAGSVTSLSSGFQLFEGPYAASSEHCETQSGYSPSQEYVVLARGMTKKSDGFSFSSGNLEELRKQTEGNDVEILAITLRWEP